MHTRTRSGRKLAPRHEAGHCLFFRLGALFPELFFVACETRSAHAGAPNHSHSSSDVRQRPTNDSRVHTKLATQRKMCTNIYT